MTAAYLRVLLGLRSAFQAHLKLSSREVRGPLFTLRFHPRLIRLSPASYVLVSMMNLGAEWLTYFLVILDLALAPSKDLQQVRE